MKACGQCKTPIQTGSVRLDADGRTICSGCGSHVELTDEEISAVVPSARTYKTIGPFEIKSEISRGGMGIVYNARDRELDRTIALKVMIAGEHASLELIERFIREARTAANLQHPGIVQVYRVGQEGGLRYIAMEFVDGEGLDAWTRRPEKDVKRIAAVIRDAARALHFAHQHGIIHRDIKPANLMITRAGEVKVADFGLARLVEDSQITQSGMIMGTPSYMSPEQATGENLGPLSDLYSLGATLYALLAGKAPFVGETPMGTIMKACNEEPVPPSRHNRQVPPPLDAIVLKTIRKLPKERYADAEGFAADLDRFVNDRAVLARPETFSRRMVRKVRKNPWPLAAAIAILVAVAVVGTVLLLPEEKPPPVHVTPPSSEELWTRRFETMQPRLSFVNFKTVEPEAVEEAAALLDDMPASLEGSTSAWFRDQAEYPDVWARSEWLNMKGQALRITAWADMIATVLDGRGGGLVKTRAFVVRSAEPFRAVVAYRGEVRLKILAMPFAEVGSVQAGGVEYLRSPDTTPLLLTVDIGELRIELAHPELGTHTLTFSGQKMGDGQTWFVSGSMSRTDSFRLLQEP